MYKMPGAFTQSSESLKKRRVEFATPKSAVFSAEPQESVRRQWVPATPRLQYTKGTEATLAEIAQQHARDIKERQDKRKAGQANVPNVNFPPMQALNQATSALGNKLVELTNDMAKQTPSNAKSEEEGGTGGGTASSNLTEEQCRLLTHDRNWLSNILTKIEGDLGKGNRVLRAVRNANLTSEQILAVEPFMLALSDRCDDVHNALIAEREQRNAR